MDYNSQYKIYLSSFESRLTEILDGFCKNYADISRDSVKYAVLDGGKRVRPVLLLATTEMLGGNFNDNLDLAVALELIHSYSLVHDDLPAMDNDDFRRGKLSTHKKFGEAYGILCGDTLLNLAFEVALNSENLDKGKIESIKLLADYSGANGMIKGQVLDLINEKNSNADLDLLYEICQNKTGKLLTCPLLMASLTNGKKYYNELKEIGENLGILFQITDDILDVEADFTTLGKTPHKDENADKSSSVKILGLKGAKQEAERLYLKIKKILRDIDNSDFLSEFTDKIYNRKN